MNKLIILTTSITRGDFHLKSIGKFYDNFYKYLDKFDIYHIINIDEPKNLKKFFTKYETMYYYNEMIPEKVNKIYINENNPGFLQAYKKIISKIEELGLIDENYYYYWLEDDWEPKNNYDITKFMDMFKFKNSAYTFTDRAPLGSFRGGPMMTGSYFLNIFNIKKYMNETCDPERQMQRWLRGGYQKNGNSFMHRFSIENLEIDNSKIDIIIVCEENNINLSDLNKHHYVSGFDKSIEFSFHIIVYNEQNNIQYSVINEKNEYKLKNVNINELDSIFCGSNIKYFIIKPKIFDDEWLGRKFTEKYGLKKWLKLEDNTNYSNINFYNGYLGNWKNLEEDELRYKPEITMNKGFFSSLAYIHQCLPYLEENYFNKDIKLNLLYYSHNYGSYPNFQVFGDLVQLNYIPSINKDNKQFEELVCLSGLCKKICGKQTKDEDTSIFSSYKDDFNLANKYFFKYFKFCDKINNSVEQYIKVFKDKKVLGLHFRGTDKNKVKWVTHISIEEFIKIVDYHLEKNIYNTIFISTDEHKFIDKIKEKYNDKYEILYYDDLKNDKNNNSIHLDRLNLIEEKIKEIKNNRNNIEKIIDLEYNLKKETEINNILLENVIINSLILSKCNCVLKTHSQVSAYSKVFNPDLQIYRINACEEGYWPDSHISLYDFEQIEDEEVKNLLKSKLFNELDKKKKYLYKVIAYNI